MKDGSAEDIAYSYGIQGPDPLALEARASLSERQLTKHKWLGRILMGVSANSPARVERHMRSEIDAARQGFPPTAESHPHFEAWQPQAGPAQSHDAPRPQYTPAVVAHDYVPRHAANE